MIIKSDLNEYYQSLYVKYINQRYGSLWKQYTKGDIMFPVIGKDDVERLFDISIDENTVPPRKLPRNGFNVSCDIPGIVYDINQLKVLAYNYEFSLKKTYCDLRLAHNLFLIDYDKTDVLVLLKDDMYNAKQLHDELFKAICECYFLLRCDKSVSHNSISIDIKTNPLNGIPYKELMDYLHYEGEQPIIELKLVDGIKYIQARIEPNGYNAIFTETSYNIELTNVIFN